MTGQQWATDIEFVLRHTSPALRLVLVGRWDPPVPLHRYRLAGRLAEVRSEDWPSPPKRLHDCLNCTEST